MRSAYKYQYLDNPKQVQGYYVYFCLTKSPLEKVLFFQVTSIFVYIRCLLKANAKFSAWNQRIILKRKDKLRSRATQKLG